jgi:hypothetical protein
MFRFAPIDGARSALYFKLGRRRGTILVTKARRLIDGCSFGPEALKAIGQAFDTAWQEIAGNFGSDAAEIEAARLQLAIDCQRGKSQRGGVETGGAGKDGARL